MTFIFGKQNFLDEPFHQFGEILVHDKNGDGDYDKGIDKISKTDPSHPEGKRNLPLNSKEVRELKKKYNLDLNSKRSFNLQSGEEYFRALENAEQAASRGDIEVADLHLESAIRAAKGSGITVNVAKAEGIKNTALLNEVEWELSRAEYAAKAGNRRDLELHLKEAENSAAEVLQRLGKEIKISGERIKNIYKSFIEGKIQNAVQFPHPDSLHRIERSLNEAEAYAVVKGLHSEYAEQITQTRRKVFDELMQGAESQAWTGERVEKVEGDLASFVQFAENYQLLTQQDRERVEEIERINYLKGAQRTYETNPQKSFAAWLGDDGRIDAKVEGYAAKLGLSGHAAIKNSYLLDAERAADRGEVEKTVYHLRELEDFLGNKPFFNAGLRKKMGELHRKALSIGIGTNSNQAADNISKGIFNQAEEALKKADKYLRSLERYGDDTSFYRERAKYLWENRHPLAVNGLLREAGRAAKIGAVSSVKLSIQGAKVIAKKGGLDFSPVDQGRSEMYLAEAYQRRVSDDFQLAQVAAEQGLLPRAEKLLEEARKLAGEGSINYDEKRAKQIKDLAIANQKKLPTNSHHRLRLNLRSGFTIGQGLNLHPRFNFKPKPLKTGP